MEKKKTKKTPLRRLLNGFGWQFDWRESIHSSCGHRHPHLPQSQWLAVNHFSLITMLLPFPQHLPKLPILLESTWPTNFRSPEPDVRAGKETARLHQRFSIQGNAFNHHHHHLPKESFHPSKHGSAAILVCPEKRGVIANNLQIVVLMGGWW